MTIDLEDLKAKVIRAMIDIDAGIPKAVLSIGQSFVRARSRIAGSRCF
jgi:hypothetical protein